MTESQAYIEKIKEKISDLQNQLDDTELEKSMIFRQTGLHVSSSKVAEQIKEFEKEIQGLKKQIASLQKQIEN